MKCAKGVCPETSNDPKITVTILDQEKGSGWGYYCNYDCALKDIGSGLFHLYKGGKMNDLPEPTPEVVSEEGNPAAQIDPLALFLSDGFTLPDVVDGSGWDPNQKHINEISLELAKAMKCKLSAGGNHTKSAAGAIQPIYLSVGATIRMSGTNIQVDVGSEEYDVYLTPGAFKTEDAIKMLAPHLQTAIEQMKAPQVTAQF